jgi:hypothetical protein
LNTLSHVTVGPEGDLYVSQYAGGRFPVYHSTDAGAAFTQASPFIASQFEPSHGYPFGTEQNYLDLFDHANFPIRPSPFPLNDDFRTQSVRDIVADPAHPGRVYAVEAIEIFDQNDNLIDGGEINFARSDDYGTTWESLFTVGGNSWNASQLAAQFLARFRPSLNDDDASRLEMFATSLANAVISGHALPHMTVDNQGNIGVIWYDTRRDPANHNLDVFGTVSTDGGLTFSANYRLTDVSFDPDTGAPRDGAGNAYIGDAVGLAAINGTAYAVWTDSRRGNQDIEFQRYSLLAPPAPLGERFEPNDTPQTATDLGKVQAQLLVPRLSLSPGDGTDWFRVQAGATGDFVVTATAPTGGTTLQLQLYDAGGTTLLTGGTPITDSSGAVVGEEFSFHSISGQSYLVNVQGLTPSYALTLQSLTGDFGTTVQASADGTITSGGQDDYRFVTAVSGSLDVTLTLGTGFSGNVQVLSADGQAVLATGQVTGDIAHIRLTVDQGQTFLIQVSGSSGSAGSYHLLALNLDQFETQGNNLLFPVAATPSGMAMGDLNRDGKPDLVVTSNQSDQVSVLLNNGDGTLQAPREYAVGPGINPEAAREPVLADLTGNGVLDLIVPDYTSGQVSVLLGRGDGTFYPERRFDAVLGAASVAAGDFNGDGIPDLAVLSRVPGSATVAVLYGRGDGTFLPPVLIPIPGLHDAYPIRGGDLTGSGRDDLLVFGDNDASFQVLLSNPDGTFRLGDKFSTGEVMFNAQVADLDGRRDANGKPVLDVITTGAISGNVYVSLGNGDGTFQPPIPVPVAPVQAGDNVGIVGVTVGDYGSPAGFGAPDGKLDLVVTAESRFGKEAPQLLFLPGVFGTDRSGNPVLFGAPQRLGTLTQAGQAVAGDFTGDGSSDVAIADQGGVRLIYGTPPGIAPNTTQQTARNMGTVVHALGAARAIVAGSEDAWYTVTVPTEAAPGAGEEVIDFSVLYQHVGGAGLQLQVTDTRTGQVYTGDPASADSGQRLRVVAAQGDVLLVHVYGLPGGAGGTAGYGTYTMDMDVLPQVVSTQAESPVPGGPVTSFVLTLQGDRLDPAAAADPANYTVTLLGTNGAGDRVIPLASAAGAQPVVYDPGANVDVVSGLTYATAVRQTVTLLFDQPLQPGSYVVTVSPNVSTAAFSAGEAGLLAGGAGGAGHGVVSVAAGAITGGGVAPVVVAPSGTAGDLSGFAQGTPFLTQLDDDLSALLDQALAEKGDDPGITAALNQQIEARFAALYAAADPATRATLPSSLAIIWLDPVSLDVKSPQGQRASYSLQKNQVSNNLDRTFVDVSRNVEVVVMANEAGTFKLNVADVPAAARGGAVVLGATTSQLLAFTDGLREGQTSFVIQVPEAVSSTAETLANTAVSVASAAFGQGTVIQAVETSAASVTRQTATALVVAFLTGVPANTGPAVVPTAPAEALVPAAGPAADLASVAAGAAAGGGDERPPAPGAGLRAVIDEVLQHWLPTLTATTGADAQLLVGTVGDIAALVASEAAQVLPTLGLPDLTPPDMHWDGLVEGLIRSGMAAAATVGKWRGPRAQAPTPAGGAVRDAAAAPQTPAPMEEEQEEMPLPPEVRLPANPLLKPEVYGTLLLFLAGAYQAGWRDATAAAERKRTRRRPR